MKYKGKARAYANIALIKYWGKSDNDLIIPMNNSISLTLDRFYTETTVAFDDAYKEDYFILNGKAIQDDKVIRFIDTIRQVCDTNMYAHIESENHVPTAAGLASSSSGLAALTAACNEALGTNMNQTELSRLARKGSGSASRSIFGGFVEWEKGVDDQTSYSRPLASSGWENELSMVIVVVNDQSKKVSSRKGMAHTKNTSRFYQYWLDTIETDLQTVKQAIDKQDFKLLGETIEENALRMHATNIGAQPPFSYLTDESYLAMEVVHNAREKGQLCYYTMDAGPNVKILVEKKNQEALVQALEKSFKPSQILTSNISPVGIEILK